MENKDYKILLSKYNQFPDYELIAMGLINYDWKVSKKIEGDIFDKRTFGGENGK